MQEQLEERILSLQSIWSNYAAYEEEAMQLQSAKLSSAKTAIEATQVEEDGYLYVSKVLDHNSANPPLPNVFKNEHSSQDNVSFHFPNQSTIYHLIR